MKGRNDEGGGRKEDPIFPLPSSLFRPSLCLYPKRLKRLVDGTIERPVCVAAALR